MPQSKHNSWFIGILIVGGTLLLVLLGIYVYREYTTPDKQINRALEKTSKVDPVPITQEDIDRALGRVTKTKPIRLDQKTIDEAMSKTQQ